MQKRATKLDDLRALLGDVWLEKFTMIELAPLVVAGFKRSNSSNSSSRSIQRLGISRECATAAGRRRQDTVYINHRYRNRATAVDDNHYRSNGSGKNNNINTNEDDNDDDNTDDGNDAIIECCHCGFTLNALDQLHTLIVKQPHIMFQVHDEVCTVKQ